MKKTVKYDICQMMIEVTYEDKVIDDIQIFASESFTMTEDRLRELRNVLNDILGDKPQPNLWPHAPGIGTRGVKDTGGTWTINNGTLNEHSIYNGDQ